MSTSLRLSSGLLVIALGCTATAPPPPPAATAPAPVPAAAPLAPAAPAAAKKGPVDTLGKEARASYRAALVEGRALHHKGDYRAAIAAFERALAIDPDDPRALAELGWAAFFVPDLDLAEAKTRAALDRTVEAKGKGAALYNLGRIAEQRGKTAEAIALYQQSLRERPNGTVRDRLATLDLAAATAHDVLTPVTLRGPFTTLKEYCAGHTTHDGATIPCDPDAAFPSEVYEGPTAIPRGEGPILEARVLWAPGVAAPSTEAEVLVMLAIRTEKGWFVSPTVADVYNPGAFGIHGSMTARSLELADLVAGGAPELSYRFVSNHYDSDMGINEYDDTSETSLVICGIGASGKPSCTGAIPQEFRSERAILFPEDDEPGAKHEGLYETHYALRTTIAADGTITIASDDAVTDTVRPLLGARRLMFP